MIQKFSETIRESTNVGLTTAISFCTIVEEETERKTTYKIIFYHVACKPFTHTHMRWHRCLLYAFAIKICWWYSWMGPLHMLVNASIVKKLCRLCSFYQSEGQQLCRMNLKYVSMYNAHVHPSSIVVKIQCDCSESCRQIITNMLFVSLINANDDGWSTAPIIGTKKTTSIIKHKWVTTAATRKIIIDFIFALQMQIKKNNRVARETRACHTHTHTQLKTVKL